MKQVIDEIKSGDADLTEMHNGGAWRDFNIPGNNRPHITAIYGKQDLQAIETANKFFSERQLSFTADAISVFQIDENGNLYGSPIFQASFQI